MSFTSPELMRTLRMKLPYTEVEFYPEVKSKTGLSSLRVSCKRPLNHAEDISANIEAAVLRDYILST